MTAKNEPSAEAEAAEKHAAARREALRTLDVARFVLAIHDVSFPSAPAEQIGRGTPYGDGARDFFAFAAALGFDGFQLGPQGQTSIGNLSPYDGSVFSKSFLDVPLPRFGEGPFGRLVDEASFARALAAGGAVRTRDDDGRADHARAFGTIAPLVRAAGARFRARRSAGDPDALALDAAIAAAVAASPRLASDALFEAFAVAHGTDDPRRWPATDRAPSDARRAAIRDAHADVVDGWLVMQAVLDREHVALRAWLGERSLRLYGDLQVGLSLRDRFANEALFLRDYAMGAPPSRTNPEGQPWGYPVFDPAQYPPRAGAETDVVRFVEARIAKLFREFDGVRIDHPHGLVCPWVYDATLPDAMAAVIAGTRLFESPSPFAPDHPRIERFAIARADQIDPKVTRYDDERVITLDARQIDAYAFFFDRVMRAAAAHGRNASDVLCEVLSTCPAPLGRVMDRFGLGRFRVTQKASLADPSDVYRGENAAPEDWTMIGNHDTPPLRRVVEGWRAAGTLDARIAYLATRLASRDDDGAPSTDARTRALVAWLRASDGHVMTAMLAELFLGPARNVLVFWADLFGERESYNVPGLVSPTNWSMRVPSTHRTLLPARAGRGEAPDLDAALALALEARAPRSPLAPTLWRSALTPHP